MRFMDNLKLALIGGLAGGSGAAIAGLAVWYWNLGG